MKNIKDVNNKFHQSELSRRQFVTSAIAGSLALGLSPSLLRAQTQVSQAPVTLRGNVFDLNIGYKTVNYTGTEKIATAINGSVPAPILRWREGDEITLRVTNNLAVDSSIHWHGIILPSSMDGVPGMSFDGIRLGESFEYKFPINQSGTYWYHSHSGFQEQTGMYGAIVVDPIETDPISVERDYVVLLSDWSDTSPEKVYATLKKRSHYYNFNQRTVGDIFSDIRNKGVAQTWNERAMWNQMRMTDRDIADVTAYTYTYLMNGASPDPGWLGLFNRNERIRLRFINGSAMTIFDVRIPGLKMTVVAADGQNIEPITVDEFRIGTAETYDVIVEPDFDNAYAVFAQSIDRSGYALGTLTSDVSLKAEIPAMDPRPILSMRDMGMAMQDMDMPGMQMSNSNMPMQNMDMSAQPMEHQHTEGMDMSAMEMDMPAQPMEHQHTEGMDMSAMGMDMPAQPMEHQHTEGMDMSAMGMDMSAQPMEHQHTEGMDMSNMSMRMRMDMDMGSSVGMGSDQAIVHADTEFGPQVDMRSASPQSGLNDPGIGLREHQNLYGRKVLTYADIHNLYPTIDTREPSREIQLHLTGNMQRYMWSMNGIPFSDAEPLRLTYGERVRFTLVNDTMMTHPIHLHGMWSELETGSALNIPRKHTVLVQPGSKISYLVTADARGSWAYHCHLLYHMMGMFREVVVS